MNYNRDLPNFYVPELLRNHDIANQQPLPEFNDLSLEVLYPTLDAAAAIPTPPLSPSADVVQMPTHVSSQHSANRSMISRQRSTSSGTMTNIFGKTEIIPCLKVFENGIQPGQVVAISGVFYGQTFTLKLTASHVPGQRNIPFQMTVNDKENIVVFNDRYNGCWGDEITMQNPFNKGEPFQLQIKAHHSSSYFEIFGNGTKFFKFKFRQVLDSINQLFLFGDVQQVLVDCGNYVLSENSAYLNVDTPNRAQADDEASFNPHSVNALHSEMDDEANAGRQQ